MNPWGRGLGITDGTLGTGVGYHGWYPGDGGWVSRMVPWGRGLSVTDGTLGTGVGCHPILSRFIFSLLCVRIICGRILRINAHIKKGVCICEKPKLFVR